MREKVLPIEQELRDFYEEETWTIPAKHQELQAEAKAAGLWNLFLPLETDPEAKYGAGLTNLEYAHLCEVLLLLYFILSSPACNMLLFWWTAICSIRHGFWAAAATTVV